MHHILLKGRSILLVEDEPLVALDIADCLRSAGASVMSALNLQDGLRLAGHPDVAAAIIDFGFNDGDARGLCARLNERQIPFLLHTGYSDIDGVCEGGIVVPKPATPEQLLSALGSLLQSVQDERHANCS